MKKNLSKLNFSYDLGGLAAYTDALNSDIVSEAVLTPVTMEYVNVIPGIKGTQNVNLLSETLEVQTGINCGWSNSGQTTFTVAPVTVQALKVNMSLCLQQLNTLWLGQYLNAGSYNENAPFEQAIIDLQTKQIKRYNEDLLWNATTGSSTNTFSGFKELIVDNANTSTGATAPNGVVTLTGQTALCSVTGATAQEKANAVLAEIDNLINAMSRDIYDRDDIVIFMSQAQFKCYITAIRNVNNFYIDSSENKLGSVYSVYHPQTNFKVVGVPGLAGSNLIVLGPQQYFLVGVDLASDEDSFRAWWSQDFQEVRIMASWKLGTQIAFPQFFVSNGLS
jgi:enamine deaminase RidA (YjgF/YER057c/UK114 family)